MSTTCASSRQRTIVVPRPLAGFFQERLNHMYAARPDVRVVVDRRTEDRRLAAPAVSHLPERRKADRRAGGVYWSLEDMPFTAAVGD